MQVCASPVVELFFLSCDTNVSDDGRFNRISIVVPAVRTRQAPGGSVVRGRRAVAVIVVIRRSVPDDEAFINSH